MQKLLFSLGIASFLHLVGLILLGLLPVAEKRQPVPSTEPNRTGLTLTMNWNVTRRPRPRAVPDPDEYVSVDVAPAIRIAEVPAVAPPRPLTAALVGTGQDLPEGNATPSGLVPVGRSTLLNGTDVVRSVVFVIDRSVSMGPSGALDRAREELRATLLHLPSGCAFQILAYNNVVTSLVRSDLALVEHAGVSLASVLDRLDEITPSGRTDHFAAIRTGLSLRPQVLFLLTDASDLRLDDIRNLTAINRGRSAIHVVELSRTRQDQGETPLVRLAKLNGGQHRRLLLH